MLPLRSTTSVLLSLADSRTEYIQHQQMRKILILSEAVLASVVLQAGVAADRFIQKVKLPLGLTAVVAEGDLEARSIGSFSVRTYSAENARPGDDTTFFVTGVIHERDGSIEKVALADIDGDGRVEIVVAVRSAGSGSYLSAHAFAYDKKTLVLLGSVADLAPEADPIAELKKTRLKKP